MKKVNNMEKLNFKNGEVGIITDIDEIVKLTIDNLKVMSDESRDKVQSTIENYLRSKNPSKCLMLKSKCEKEYNFMYYYTEENGEKYYDSYNGYFTGHIKNDELFYEYYKTVNDDGCINNILNKIKPGDEIFIHEQYSTIYKKTIVEKLEIELLYTRLVVSVYYNKGKKFPIERVNKNGHFDCPCHINFYPSSFKEYVENKMLEHKKKRLKSLERSINKLKNEIENGIVW